MEKRVAKVNISDSGGTATKGSKTCKITLPTLWLKKLGICEDQRELELAFDGERITIMRRLAGKEFTTQKLSLGHDVRILRFFDGDKLCSTIYADFTDETLTVENHIVEPVKTAFGNNVLPNWADFQSFLEERCIPRQRAGLREFLAALGLDEYDPLAIIQKTSGRMAEDEQWIELEAPK
ncbi:hypothetical protein CE91St41_26690 [Oscillospiraceae bacterium]|nr:hypothetical protein CE91St40_10850 [Oscillospiraceae bacterium]BDF75780.1 hypothetical protein CE91St41_26690 [Oscillospiraceae bacterium]